MQKSLGEIFIIWMSLLLPIAAWADILYENPWQTGGIMPTTHVRADRLIAAPAIIRFDAIITTLTIPISAWDSTSSGLSIRICKDSDDSTAPDLGDCTPFSTTQTIPIGDPSPVADITFAGVMPVSADEKIWVIITKDDTPGEQFNAGASTQGTALPGGFSFDNGTTWDFYSTMQRYMRIEGPRRSANPIPTTEAWVLALMSLIIFLAGVVQVKRNSA